ncbi:MAG: M14 family zinc carboxypeptidase [Acidobacteriota bacterium]
MSLHFLTAGRDVMQRNRQGTRTPIGVGAVLTLLFALLITMSPGSNAAGKGETGPVRATRVELADRTTDLQLFHTMDLDVDAVFEGWARLYLTEEEETKLRRMGYALSPLPPSRAVELSTPSQTDETTNRAIPSAYHTYDTLTSELNAIAAAHPTLTRLTSLGPTASLPPDPVRELWMMKISDNPDADEDEPEVAYIAAMHGDEVVGKELCIEFIHYLLDNYGTDSRVTNLVDNTEIWILPSMNPDGTAASQRYNYNGFDLNRDFPDWFADPVNTTAGRQPETVAVMNWVAAHSISLSANFHGGALVANYPWDSNATASSVYSPTPAPDHDAFYSISRTYAQNNPPMDASSSFTDGVTNGAAWYAISGGMQDWGYAWYGKFDVTLEVSDTKWPAAAQLPTFWSENQESMLSYLERAHEGVRGIVSDSATGVPVAAEIRVDADPFAVYTDPDLGDYHRIVMPGSYTLEISAPGYYPASLPIVIAAGPAARYDVGLQPLPSDLQPVSTRVESEPSGNGWIDPGETVELAVTLKNLGSLATSIGGRLIPTGWYAELLQAESTYPDLASQAESESNAPHHTIQIDPATPAGHKIGLAVEWSAAQGGGTSEPIFVALGGTACDTSVPNDLPQSIIDYQSSISEIPIVAGVEIDDLQVYVDITHTYIGDLTLELLSPQGTTVLLHNRTGGGTDDILGSYGLDLTSAESLAVFDDEPSTGTWKLTVSDGAGGDSGTLNEWNLEICGRPLEATTPQMLFREVSVEPGGVQLRWWPYPGLHSYRVYRSTDPSSANAFTDVTAEDSDATDTLFQDGSVAPISYFLVTGVGPQGEGPKGHFGE